MGANQDRKECVVLLRPGRAHEEGLPEEEGGHGRGKERWTSLRRYEKKVSRSGVDST